MKLEKPLLFSIIIPVYRVEEYLTECVESLLNQTYSNLEIILVDDGSPDECPAMCDEYARKDERIRVIHKENGGPNRARKAGAEIAEGHYICCVDSDDYVSNDYIERLADAIREYQADIVCCGAYFKMEQELKKKPLQNRYGYYSKADIEKEIFPKLIQTAKTTYFPPALWAKAVRADLFKNQLQHVDDAIKMGEDGACIIPCIYEANSMAILPQCLYYYRYNDSSLTKNRKAFRWDGPRLIAEHLRERLDINQYDFKEQLDRKIVHELFSVVKSQFYREERYCVIKRDILQQLQDSIYHDAIRNSRFSGISGIMAHFALKYRQLWLIYLFSIIM